MLPVIYHTRFIALKFEIATFLATIGKFNNS
jgi:hypothetical protein